MKIVKKDVHGILRVIGVYYDDPFPFICIGHKLKTSDGHVISSNVLWTPSEPNPRKRMEWVIELHTGEYVPPPVYEKPVQLNFLDLF